MTPNQQFAKVGDLAIHYDLADYTDPWRTGERETFLLAPDAVVAEVRKFLQENQITEGT